MRISPLKTNLAKMRVASKIPQKQVAAAIGVSTRHLQFVEAGERRLSIERENAVIRLIRGI